MIAVGGGFLLTGLIWDLSHPLEDDEIRGPGNSAGSAAFRWAGGCAPFTLTPYLFVLLTGIAVVLAWFGAG